MENAYKAIRHGRCSAALVGGVSVLLKPNTSVQFMKMGMLSPDGACKAFDASGKAFSTKGHHVVCKELIVESVTTYSAITAKSSPRRCL